MSTTSVIMVSYHTGSVLNTAIASVLRQDDLADLIIVDNGNPPDVLARLRQMALIDPRIKVITGQGNIGFAAGCNLGAENATGEFLLLLNPDCILPPNTLTTLAREINTLPNTMLAGVHLVNPDGSEQRGGRRHLLTPMSALAEMLGTRRLNLHRTPLPHETHDVPAISGACMFIHKKDYQLLGGMDEKYFLHVEDLDFCMKVKKHGKRIICVPSITIAHLLSTSGNTNTKLLEFHKARGFAYYFEKHFKESLLPGILPLLKAAIWLRYYLRRMQKAAPLMHGRGIIASRKISILASSLTAETRISPLRGRTVFVTGATSQVGLYVIKHLLASGAAVLAVSRERPLPFAHPHLMWLQKDITRDNFSLEGYLADVAVHCAPAWHLPKIIPILAESDVKRLVAISSTSVFSKATSHNHFERELVGKFARAEADIMSISGALGIGTTILRPTMIYGAGLDKNITSIARLIEKFGFAMVYPPAMGRRQPVHAEDVAMAVIQSLESDITVGRSYNVSGAETLTYHAMLERIFRVMKRPVRIHRTTLLPLIFSIAGTLLHRSYLTREVALRMNEDLVFFHDDAERDFSYAPRPFLSAGMIDIDGEE